ncbi:MAG: hypothetical protein JXD18_06545 [Anaerolineae bacterium]|nr:hypothetical protein [Anaerolineae bacterium]
MNQTSSSRAALLLADPSPCLRLLVLQELLGYPDDDSEVQELLALRERDPLVRDLLDRQADDGSWEADGRLWQGGRQRASYLALMRLGYVGFDVAHPAVRRGAEYLFSLQQDDGSWSFTSDGTEGGEREGYVMVPLQTALPLRALAMCGYSSDPRAERAYTWLLSKRLDDGAWPTGIAGGTEADGVYGYVAGYRRLAHSRWGCRSNTTSSLLCLAYHPEWRTGPEARRALDLLLGRETREAQNVGLEVARLVGAEPTRGFFTFFARFDLALLLDLCWRIGATTDDARVADLVAFVTGLRGEYGLWPYLAQPQVSRWVTFDLLRSLTRLQARGDWMGDEPRTPFQPYPTRRKRF